MKVYIIYDRYEGNEFFQIYNICKSINEVKQVYKQSLIDFCECSPDDCHSFQCQEVKVTDKELKILEDYMKNGKSPEGYKLMEKIYEDCVWCYSPDSNCLFCTDGCTDNTDVFVDYMSEQHPDVDEDSDEWYDMQDEFYSDDDLYKSELNKYIDRNYQI